MQSIDNLMWPVTVTLLLVYYLAQYYKAAYIGWSRNGYRSVAFEKKLVDLGGDGR